MRGTLEVLNVGLGDMKLSWNPDDPEDVKRAQDVIESLMRKGYAVLVKDEASGEYTRAEGYDREQDAYIVPEREPKTGKVRRGRRARATSTATAVARSAGG